MFPPSVSRSPVRASHRRLRACRTRNKVRQNSFPGTPTAPSQVTPREALETARIYCTHPWRPFATNIKHGVDPAGIRIDTPDAGYHPANGRNGWWIPGEVNEGIPYKWGGFDDPASFDAAIASGHAGGDVSSPAKRQADNAQRQRICSRGGLLRICLALPPSSRCL